MKATDVTVRPATTGDTQAISRLLSALGYSVTPDDVRSRMSVFMANGSGSVIVGEQEGSVVAFAALELTYPLHDAGPVMHLSAFAVDERKQRSGIGRAMISAIEKQAIFRGCVSVVVTSAEHRAGAHAFYPRVGWAYTGRRFGKRL